RHLFRLRATTVPVTSFASSAPHVDLHSFPTRRSSDLSVFHADNPAALLDSVLRVHEAHGLANVHIQLHLEQAAVGVHDEVGCVRDRKSTRLNSSHGSISYAVFCVKKRNTTTPPHRRHE